MTPSIQSVINERVLIWLILRKPDASFDGRSEFQVNRMKRQGISIPPMNSCLQWFMEVDLPKCLRFNCAYFSVQDLSLAMPHCTLIGISFGFQNSLIALFTS